MKLRTDSELVRLATGGDAEAFAELVRRYRDVVYGYCYYRTGSFEDACDLCQETFIRAYRKLDQVREPEKVGGWLRRVAANLCNRWFERRREIPLEERHLPQPEPESPRAALVREALSSLPDNERLVVVMHYVDGLSYAEIAEFLETSVGAVKGRLYRGREMLKKEVLNMTQEAFGEHRLDEEFVLKSVRLALDASHKACWEKKDAALARTKADEAIDMLDRLGSSSPEADQAKYEALMRTVHATQDIDERVRLIERAWDFGIQSSDAPTVVEALRSRVRHLIWKRDPDAARELIERARKVARDNGLADQLALCDAAEADVAFLRGDVESSKTLLRQSLDALREFQPIPGQEQWTQSIIAIFQAGLRGLETLPIGANALMIYYNAATLREESDQISLASYTGGNFRSTPDFVISPKLPVLPNALPHFELGWLEPDKLLALPPKVGQSWCSETLELGEWYRIDTAVESDSDTVVVGGTQFNDCLRVGKLWSGPRRRGVDWERQIYGKRTIWFAPGVGMVKTIHEPEEGEAVNAELVDFHIAGGTGYLPVQLGNWWNYRWVEGEEDYGFRTQDRIYLSERAADGDFVTEHYISCWV